MATTIPSPTEMKPVPTAPADHRADAQMVAMRDGVRLATDVYLPDPPGQRCPTVLIRLPYDKCGRYTFMPAIARYLNAHGFAVAVQDVRGKFRSEGVREPFAYEAVDGYDTLDWIVAQSWSDGAVAMTGDSYYGFTQWAAASTGHPALKAIVPRVTGSVLPDQFRISGIPRIAFLEWSLQIWSAAESYETPLLVHDPVGALAGLPETFSESRQRILELAEPSGSSRLAERIFPGGSPSTQLKIPALHMGGWFDNLQKWQLDDWRTTSARSPAAAHQFLRMDISDHEDFVLSEDGIPPGDHETDDDALRLYLPRLLDEQISFMHHYLGGADGRWKAPRVRYRMAYAGWEVADRWTPDMTEEVTLAFADADAAFSGASGGRLLPAGESGRAETGSTTVEWLHDPTDPVPYAIEWEWAMTLALPDESQLHERADVPTFTGDAAHAPVDLLGPAWVELTIDADAPSTHAIARLLDVAPDGTARFILEGAEVVDTSAGPVRVRLRLGDTAYRVRPGHQLRVAISTSSFPQYLVHPGTDQNPLVAVEAKPAAQRLLVGGGEGARLELTVRRSLPR